MGLIILAANVSGKRPHAPWSALAGLRGGEPGSDYRELLGDWADLTATIGSVDAAGERVALIFPAPFPCWTSGLPAAEFPPDRPLSEALF